jgi:hypothetical protein
VGVVLTHDITDDRGALALLRIATQMKIVEHRE